MTFLLIDTSGEYAVLALAGESGKVEAVSIFEGKRSLSRRLMGEMDNLLERNGLSLQEVSAFAVGLGPGSFTGVRVGVTTMKTLAQVTGKPLVGVGTLDAYAAIWQTQGSHTAILPVLPSRRGEVYAALYRGGECEEAPFAEAIDALQVRLQGMGDVIVYGQGYLLGELAGLQLTQPYVPPEGLAHIAARRLANGDYDDPLALVPLYVVAPSISAPKEKPRLAFAEQGTSGT